MNATPTDEIEADTSAKDGVGQYLRKAREAVGLGRAEAAAGLYLNESIVIALEEDDHDALPGPVFVQGYLRKYARLLDIPEEPLLKAYSHQAVPRKQPKKDKGRPLAGSPIKPEIRSSHTIVRLITWVIVLGLLALVALWWQSDMRWPVGELSDEQPTATQERESELSFASGLPEPENKSYQDEEESGFQNLEPAVTALDNGQIEQVLSESSISAPSTEMVNHSLVSDEPAPATSETKETELPAASDVVAMQELELDTALGRMAEAPAETPMVEALAQPAPPPVEQAPEAPVDYANSIVIEFAEACWTEIRGFNNSYKLLGNMQKGERYLLGGEPPYTFVLGNSHAVTLTIKGQVFDLTAHTKGNIARFVLQAEDIPNS